MSYTSSALLYRDASLTHESISYTLFEISNVHILKTPLVFIQYLTPLVLTQYNADSLLSFEKKNLWKYKIVYWGGWIAFGLLISVSIHN